MGVLNKARITGKNYIGSNVSALGSITYGSFNPHENKPNEFVFFEASEAEIDAACALAAEAFRSYRNTSEQERYRFLCEIADALHEDRELLIHYYMLESGLPHDRAHTELDRTLFQLRSYGAFVAEPGWKQISYDAPDASRQPFPKPELSKQYVPLGPVVVFGASNFPFAYSTAGGDTASALAAGCPVIVKSHPMHAATSELVAQTVLRVVNKCNMPNGVFSHVNGSSFRVGERLVMNDHIKAVGFTGSQQGGRAIFNLACSRKEPIPVFAEMGSTNPVIISNLAIERRAEHWITMYANAITQGNGQFCTKPGIILLHDNPTNRIFGETLGKRLREKEKACMLHPDIKGRFDQKRNEIRANTAALEIGPESTLPATHLADQTLVSILGADYCADPIFHQEVFGPFAVLVFCRDTEEQLRVIDAMEGQLTGTLICEEDEMDDFVPLIEALRYKVGRMIFNGVPTGVEVSEAMHHGGPYPASTDSRFTAVGPHAVYRWVRPVTFQNFPEKLRP